MWDSYINQTSHLKMVTKISMPNMKVLSHCIFTKENDAFKNK